MTLPAELRAEYENGLLVLRVMKPGTLAYETQHRKNELLHRAADALEAPGVIGECVEAGTDPETGDIRLIVQTTIDAIRSGPHMVFRHVKVTPLPATPEGV